MSLYKSENNYTGKKIKNIFNIINFSLLFLIIALISGFPIAIIPLLDILIKYQQTNLLVSLAIYIIYSLALISLIFFRSEVAIKNIINGILVLTFLSKAYACTAMNFPVPGSLGLAFEPTSSVISELTSLLALRNGGYIMYLIAFGDFLINCVLLLIIKNLLKSDNFSIINLLKIKKIKEIFATSLLLFIIPLSIKLNLIPYQTQVNFMGIKPGEITITSYGFHKSLCYISMDISIKDSIQWKSVDASIIGIDINGEQFRRVQRFSLDKYDTVKIRAPFGWCENVKVFNIEKLSNFIADGLSDQDSAERAEHFTYKLNETNSDNIELSPYLRKKK
jgi:hypothetical protein